MPCIKDIGVVIHDYYRLREEEVGYSPFIRELDDSRVGHMLAIAPHSVYIMNRNIQPCYSYDQEETFCTARSYFMKRKPHLHGGTVIPP